MKNIVSYFIFKLLNFIFLNSFTLHILRLIENNLCVFLRLDSNGYKIETKI